MEEAVKYSKLLQHIVAVADEIKNESVNKAMSVNVLFAAFIKFCNETTKEAVYSMFDAEEHDDIRFSEEVDDLFSLMSGCIGSDKYKEYIKLLSSKPVSFTDEVQYSRFKATCQSHAKSSELDVLYADTVLDILITRCSTPEMKRILSEGDNRISEPSKGASSRENSSAENTGEEGQSDIARMIAEKIKAKKNQEEETVEKIEDPEEKLPPKEKIAAITEKVKQMQRSLSQVIFGQDNAISVFVSGYFQSQLRDITDKECKKPKASFLFAGPPGVGKTFLAETSAQLLGLPFKRFDMSEYSEYDAVKELCGTNPVYAGNKEGELTGYVKKHPKCVLLFDEIEKAHIKAIHLFLQVLDAGRLRDTNTGKEVDFSQTTVIFTTNAGRMVYEGSETSNLSHIPRKTILKALEKDVDPKTGLGVFPAAICSRFATGNVVMFNHMEAHVLRNIAEKEIKRNVRALEKETGIKCNVADDIYSSILFAEGGHADARTVKSRANAFFSTELYELFRLVSAPGNDYEIEAIEEINFSIEDTFDEDIRNLFIKQGKLSVLVFASEEINESIRKHLSLADFSFAGSCEEAMKMADKKEYDLILCDLYAGRTDDDENLNIEDIESEGRDFFRFICGETNTPLYIAYNRPDTYTEEELFSLMRDGARGGLDVSNGDALSKNLQEIFRQIHQQASMVFLSRSNKIVSYQTSQVMSEDRKIANIELYDLEMETAVDSEDTGSIMSAASKPTVKFEDVIGAQGAKEELEFFVDYLKNPKKFENKGLGVPKGVLFYGPPGTGKTLLAKAVAGESDVTFISTQGNQFIKPYYGDGEESVRQLFATARKYAPTIIFIDEVDAFAKERIGGDRDAQPQRVLTTFLAEMDGFKTNPKKPVFVLAATNYDVEPGSSKCIDSAFVRRFDRSIYVELPDKQARIQFIRKKIDDGRIYKLSDNEVENIAVRSTGASLAKLELIFGMALRLAIRAGKDSVDDEIFEEAFETYSYGDEKKWDASILEKTAYHEAGHAFLCWYGGENPSYLTIVARGNYGGYMQHGDTEKIGSYSKKMLLNRIRTSMGGRAAELVFFGDDDGLTTGASADLASATAVAKSIVCRYGMDESVGLAVINDGEALNGELAGVVRNAVNNILSQQLEDAKRLLRANKPAVDKIVEVLLEKNHLGGDEINNIFSSLSKREND